MTTNNSINTGFPIEATHGGTGVVSPTAHGIMVAEGASAVNPIVLTNGQLLVGSTGVDPVAASITSTGTTLAVTGGAGTINIDVAAPLNVAHGGTGATTLTAHSLLVGEGTGAVVALGAMTNGQIAIGSTGADPVVAGITAGAGISVTNGAGSITIANTAISGYAWNDTTGASATLAAGNSYVADNAALVTFTLPATAAFGDTFQILGKGAGGWKVAQNLGQSINFGTAVTTSGTGGSLASSNQWDKITITCVTANTGFSAYDAQGNITYV